MEGKAQAERGDTPLALREKNCAARIMRLCLIGEVNPGLPAAALPQWGGATAAAPPRSHQEGLLRIREPLFE